MKKVLTFFRDSVAMRAARNWSMMAFSELRNWIFNLKIFKSDLKQWLSKVVLIDKNQDINS